jgi:hypothetical protein
LCHHFCVLNAYAAWATFIKCCLPPVGEGLQLSLNHLAAAALREQPPPQDVQFLVLAHVKGFLWCFCFWFLVFILFLILFLFRVECVTLFAASSLQSSCGLYASAAACLTAAVDAARMLTSSSSSPSSSSSLRCLHPHILVSLLMSMASLAVVTGYHSAALDILKTARAAAAAAPSLPSSVGLRQAVNVACSAVVSLPFVNGSSAELVIPDKSYISEAIGLLQQCTKVQVHGLGGGAGVLYDTILAYVTCLDDRRPADTVKPMLVPTKLPRHTPHITTHTSHLTPHTPHPRSHSSLFKFFTSHLAPLTS